MLILCEKPSAARDFAGELGCTPRKGYYQNGTTVVTWCLGHLFQLRAPEAYDPAWKKWDRSHLPLFPPSFRYEKSPRTAAQAEAVLALLHKHSRDTIVVATDAGREGELIARIALAEAGITDLSGIRRFWVSEALTGPVIRAGLTAAKPWADYEALAKAAYARQHADWLIGINLTRFMSIGTTGLFSVGRVQTAVLAAIAQRNRELLRFKPVPYKTLEALIRSPGGVTIKAWLINPLSEKTAFDFSDPYVEKAFSFCQNQTLEKTAVQTVQKTEKPEKLYNLTALQKEAYKKYGYSPEKTLELAQSLYEKHKCLSYPRTPSRVMGDNNVALFVEKFKLLAPVYPQYSRFSSPSLIVPENRHVFNSSALEDHHALIPLAALPPGASAGEQNVFNLVVRSFFRVCMPDFIYNETRLVYHANEFQFSAKIKEVIREGWKKAAEAVEPGDGADQEVSGFNPDQAFLVSSKIVTKETRPPKEYSIDTLLSFMENPRAESGERLAGLGTAATRAGIISLLFQRGYVEERKKKLSVTPKGTFLLNQIDKDDTLKKIADAGQTTAWESQLRENPESFEQDIKEFIRSCVNKQKIEPKREKNRR